MKTIAIKASSFVGHTKLEDFHEFLLVCKDTFTKNLHATKISTNKIFKNVTENKDLVVMSGDKDSCVVKLPITRNCKVC